MSNDCKVCLTTYIYGDKYQDYIPLLVYSLHKAYSEYYIILFLHDKLRVDVDKQLQDCDLYHNLEFREHTFSDCPQMNSLKAKSLRWVLWDDKFNEFDYLYVVDVDMLYIREPQPLHEQHIKHIDFLQLPFSNILRQNKLNSHNFIDICRRIKYAGFRKLFSYLLSNGRIVYRVTGLHFIVIKKYYSALTLERCIYYKRMIYNKNMFNYILYLSDECFLYWMLQESGFQMERLGIQSDAIQLLDFNMPERKEFRPHHGIHLGIFRMELKTLPDDYYTLLNSPTYRYYVDIFKNEIQNDPKFIKLSKNFNTNLKIYFNRLYQYYNIDQK